MDPNTKIVEGEEVGLEQEQEGVDPMEEEARAMGWRPEVEWDGPKGRWIDAKTFVERGNQILPIVRANNKKMREELLTRDKEISKLRESVATAQKALATLRKGHNEATKREVEIAIADLKAQFKQAREVGDTDLELEVQGNIEKLTAKAKQIGEEVEEETPTEEKGKADPPAELSPEFLEWQGENKWFGNTANADDKARTEAILKVGEKLRKGGDKTVGRAFLDKCLGILEESERGYSRPKGKVEAGGERRGGGGSGRAWDSLPKDAKDICHSDNETFVGPGKMFKTVKEWEDHYANLYNQ